MIYLTLFPQFWMMGYEMWLRQGSLPCKTVRENLPKCCISPHLLREGYSRKPA
jgi:hypothetical protein